MDKNKILNEYKKMRQNIFNSKDKHLEELFKYIKTYFSKDKSLWSWEIFYPVVENIIYDSLTETYAITAESAKKIYQIKFNETIDKVLFDSKNT